MRVAGKVLPLVAVLMFIASPAVSQDGHDAAQRFYLSASGALVIPADVHAEVRGRTSVGSNGSMDVAFDAGHGLVLVAGYDLDVAEVLVSMAQQGTMNCSVILAGMLVPELGAVAPLVNRAHRFAAFRVLKAPDVPSVLIELGFLSNDRDAERLKSGSHRRTLAEAILKALDEYFVESC